MRARRFDHALLYGPDVDKTLDFFVKVLDFECAERVDMPDGLLAIWQIGRASCRERVS
jgi:catechol 2,3-dioxygenase